MAIIKMGPLVDEARGKMGGMIFSRNSSGMFMKANAMPTNARTIKTYNARASFGAMSTKWRGLEDDDRNAWITTATVTTWINSLGVEFHPTGFQLFMSYNMNNFGWQPGTIIETPQVDPTWLIYDPSGSSFAILGDDGDACLALTLNYIVGPTPITNFQGEIWVTPYISMGITRPKPSWYRRVGYYNDWGNEQQFCLPFISAVGYYIPGNRMWVKVDQIFETGGQRMLFAEGNITTFIPPP